MESHCVSGDKCQFPGIWKRLATFASCGSDTLSPSPEPSGKQSTYPAGGTLEHFLRLHAGSKGPRRAQWVHQGPRQENGSDILAGDLSSTDMWDQHVQRPGSKGSARTCWWRGGSGAHAGDEICEIRIGGQACGRLAYSGSSLTGSLLKKSLHLAIFLRDT